MVEKKKNEEVCELCARDDKAFKELKNSLYDQDTVVDLSQIFKAMSDPTRLNIIHVLSKSPLCVYDIANLLDMSQSSISHHLRLLRNLRLVKFRKEGKLVIYSLDDQHVVEIFKQGLEHVRHR